MNETMEMGPNPEEQDGDELCADFLARHPEKVVLPEERRECGPEVARFEEMVASFESTHSLAELNSITILDPKGAPNHLVREPARLALGPINTLLEVLEKETDISSDGYEELKARYRRLSRAVGMIDVLKGNRVDHER